MKRFRYKNEQNIRAIFERKTGVFLERTPKRKTGVRTVVALGLAAVLGVMVVYATELFSPLSGDDFSLKATYEGDGIVSVLVENRSNKVLDFEKTVKLLRWKTQEEVLASGKPSFQGEKIAPHSSGEMTIDLSPAYDIDLLEQPLEQGDSYYFLLTNNSFLFGHDWMCTVPFAEPLSGEPKEISHLDPPTPLELDQIEESLRIYFETIPADIDQRRQLEKYYQDAVEQLFKEKGQTVVPTSGAIEFLVAGPEPSVSFDTSVPPEEQDLLIGEHLQSMDWDQKMLATSSDQALVISASVPMKQYPDASGEFPLFYLFSYKKAAVSEDSLFFVRGRLLTVSQAESYLVYQDEEYLCYDFSEFFCPDLAQHIERVSAWHPELQWDDAVQSRIENIYRYYRENLGKLIYRRQR